MYFNIGTKEERQAELEKRLQRITNNEVSAWQMSIEFSELLPLCNSLNITVDEFLQGEGLSKKDVHRIIIQQALQDYPETQNTDDLHVAQLHLWGLKQTDFPLKKWLSLSLNAKDYLALKQEFDNYLLREQPQPQAPAVGM